MKFINFAIDLGTTNSLIAQSDNGQLKVFKNPKGFKEALPSVVAFRKNGVLIGDKARELKERDPKNVFSSFKRKMGTDDVFWIDQTQNNINPIQLSTLVLNELKTFLIDEEPQSIVITIPASFDTIQSNATKEAGFQAGFKEVVLLQEPIAACLAVFNEPGASKEGKWLIYDLGGGTFDVAIVEVTNESLKIIDHEGNNFLGGLDFDISIVQKVIIPQIRNQGNFGSLCEKLLSNSDNKEILPVFNYLLFHAEQLKIEVSSYPESFAEFSIADDDGEMQDIEIKMTRSEFNSLLDQPLNQTISLVNTLLSTNNLSTSDFNEIVLVGGSTYSPYVKEKISKELNIKVNQQIDPTSAIVIGAAHYAANKETKIAPVETNQSADSASRIKLVPVFESQSRDTEELILIKNEYGNKNYSFRIIRNDLGYDSGKQLLTDTVRISVPLKEKTSNFFTIEVYAEDGSLLEKEAAKFTITQGLFIIDGQPLPHDICIEIDDIEQNETKLVAIFKKNDILPLQKTIYRTVSKNLLTTNTSDELIINILEGSEMANPSTNQIIGCISIKPAEIGQNIIKDSEIGISISISESRDLKVSASISTIDFEIEDIFNPSAKTVLSNKLREELKFLIFKSEQKKNEAVELEEFERATIFHTIHDEASDAMDKIGLIGEIAADTKYHVEEWKRQLYVKYDELTRDQRLLSIIKEYKGQKAWVEELTQEANFPANLKARFENIISKENQAIQSGNVAMIRDLSTQLENLSWDFRKISPDHLRGIYAQYKLFVDMDGYTDIVRANQVIHTGDQILYRENASATEFHTILNQLHALLRPEFKKQRTENDGFDLTGTGIQ